MVGTHPRTMGGVSTVVRGYMEGGLFERFDCSYVPTHRDGSALVKAWAALRAWAVILAQLCVRDAPLVHIHMSSRASFWRKSVVCLMAKAMRRPYLLHMHGSEFMRFYDEECGPRARRFVQNRFRDAALVLALSEEWRANLLRICPTAAVEVLANAVAPPDSGSNDDPRSPAGVPARDAAPMILFLGRLGPRKGVFDLITAFSRIADDFATARLVCAGDGTIDEALELAKRLGVSERVSCPGWLSTTEARRLLGEASVFALPSHAEGLPMALLEAMSWGLPVVTTPVGGIPQVLRHEDNGILIRPGDVDALTQALASLLGDRSRRDRLGAAARRTIEEHYSLDAALDKLSAIYRRFGIPSRAVAKTA